MSTTPLSTTEEEIERSIFERIRLELVDKGYSPDITTMNTGSAADQQTYNTALKLIKDTLGFSIELFGSGSYQKNQDKKVPRIVIDKGIFIEGELGGDQTRMFQLNDAGTEFDALIRPSQTSDLYISIHLVANTTEQIRICQGILSLALQVRGYLPLYNLTPNEIIPTGNFFYQKVGFSDLPNLEEGVVEHVFKYKISDVYEIDCIVDGAASLITDLSLTTDINNPITVTTGNGVYQLKVNGTDFDLISGDYNVPVKDSNGLSVGYLDLSNPASPIWVVPANALDNYNITINGFAFSTINSNTDIPVKYVNGAAVGSKVGLNWEIPNPLKDIFIKGIFTTGATDIIQLSIDIDSAGTYTTIVDDGSSGNITISKNGGPFTTFTTPLVLVQNDTLDIKRTIGTSTGFYKITGTYV